MRGNLSQHIKGQWSTRFLPISSSQSPAASSFSSFNFNSNKDKKAIVKYVDLRNLSFNLVGHDKFEEIIRDAFHTGFYCFACQNCQLWCYKIV